MERNTLRSHALPVLLVVLPTLSYLATGAFMQVVGASLGLDKSTVSRCMTDFVSAMAPYLHRFVTFPTGAAVDAVKLRFREKAGDTIAFFVISANNILICIYCV